MVQALRVLKHASDDAAAKGAMLARRPMQERARPYSSAAHVRPSFGRRSPGASRAQQQTPLFSPRATPQPPAARSPSTPPGGRGYMGYTGDAVPQGAARRHMDYSEGWRSPCQPGMAATSVRSPACLSSRPATAPWSSRPVAAGGAASPARAASARVRVANTRNLPAQRQPRCALMPGRQSALLATALVREE